MLGSWRVPAAERDVVAIAKTRTERSRRRDLDRLTAALVAAGAARRPDVRRALDASPWAVIHTAGGVQPLWRAFDLVGKGGGDLPTQALDGAAATAVSTLALPGGARVVARGTFQRQDATLTVTVGEVEVEGVAGRAWRLPIAGTGATTLLYAGRDVRVLRGAGGAVAVQVRQGAL